MDRASEFGSSPTRFRIFRALLETYPTLSSDPSGLAWHRFQDWAFAHLTHELESKTAYDGDHDLRDWEQMAVSEDPIAMVLPDFPIRYHPNQFAWFIILRYFLRPNPPLGVAINPRLAQSLQSTIHHDGVMQAYAVDATNQQTAEANAGGYEMPNEVADLLNSQGVPASSMGAKSHAHPAHATIEKYCYQTAYPGLIPEKRVAVVQAKPHKVAWCGPRFFGPFNTTIEARDESRWETSLLPEKLEADAVLVWDVAQHLKPEHIGALHERWPNVRRIYWGFVYAPETRDGYSSLWPDLYELEYHGDKVLYKMEGTSQGAYEQPTQQDWLLAARSMKMISPRRPFVLQWTPLVTYFSHHLAVSDRSPVTSPLGVYSVTCTEMMRIPQPWLSRLHPEATSGEQLVPRELYRRLWQYYESLRSAKKKPEPRDLAIKIRNEAASHRNRHIRTETWQLLHRSVLAVTAATSDVPVGNAFDETLLQSAVRPLLTALLQLRIPGAVEVATKVLHVALHHYAPTLGMSITAVRILVRAAASDKWSDVSWEFGCAVLSSFLTTLPLATLGALAASVHAVAWWLQRRDRLQIKLHTEISCSVTRLNFGPVSVAAWYDPTPGAYWGHPVEQPPWFAKGGAWVRWAGGGCPSCGGPRSVGCTCARICPTHGVEDPEHVPGRPFDCCEVIRVAREFEAAWQRDHPEEAATEARHRPNATGRARMPSPSPSLFTIGTASSSLPDDIPGPSVPPPPDPAPRSEAPVPPEGESRPPSPALSDPASTDAFAAHAPPDFGFDHTNGAHVSCSCPLHQGTHAVAGASWDTCHAGYGYWRIGERACHVCEPPEQAEPHDCQCDEHRLRAGATVCAGGFPHNGERDKPCHACGTAGLAPEWAHQRVGLEPYEVYNAWHPSLRLRPGVGCLEHYPGTCAVEAMSQACGRPATEVWDALNHHLPADALYDLLPEPGLDERAFHMFGLLLGLRVQLSGVPLGTPTPVGKRSDKRVTFRLTHGPAGPHWHFEPFVPAPRLVALNRLAPTIQVTQFLADLERFKDERGARPLGEWTEVMTSPARCKTYLRELRAGITGTVSREEGRSYPKDFLKRLDASHDLARPRPIMVRAVSGAAGCGKSAPYKAFLRARAHQAGDCVWFASFPRRAILDDWRSAVPLGKHSWLLNTFEQAFRRQARVLVIDELGLFPPGYVDLLTILRPSISHVIVLAGPTQCEFHDPNELSNLSGQPGEMATWLPTASPYLLWSHRIPQVVARRLGLPSTNPEEGRIDTRGAASQRWPLICMTDSETKNARRWGFDAMTVSCYQGSEHPTVQIQIHGTFLAMGTAELLYTAVSRATRNVIFVMALSPSERATTGRIPLLAALLGEADPVPYEQTFRDKLSQFTLVRMPEERRAAIADSRRRVVRASGMVYDRAPAQLAVHLTSLPVLPPPDPKPHDPEAMEPRPRTHLPRADPSGLVDAVLADIKPREDRELRNELGMSALFEERLDDPLQTTALFPQQRASDAVLRKVTIKKRLAASSKAENVPTTRLGRSNPCCCSEPCSTSWNSPPKVPRSIGSSSRSASMRTSS